MDRIEVLDHGYVRLIEYWGHGEARVDCEAGIIEAARQSTQGSFRGWEEDARLLAYLHRNKHATPFEFAGMVIEVRAPIMVFREWHRHRTQSYNEMSARYAPLPNRNYMPTVERVMQKSNGNKQASANREDLTEDLARVFMDRLAEIYQRFESEYKAALANGVPKEIARCGMPVGRYSQMRASTCLRNWLAFLTLRLDPQAQWEIRQYAEAIGQIIATLFPQTWALFTERMEK